MVKIDFTEEEKQEIIKFSKNPNLFDNLIKNLSHLFSGNNKLKEALILQLFGGVNRVKGDGSSWAGNIHILLVGDPGSDMSKLLKRMNKLASKSVYIDYNALNNDSLINESIRNKFLNGQDLEKEKLISINDNLICINSFYRDYEDNLTILHEFLEDLTLIINDEKGINTKIISKNSVLVSSKPKFGRFDPYDNLGNQLDLPVSIITKFDLIFILRDVPNKLKDRQLAKFTLESHNNVETQESKDKVKFLKKYIAYAKQNCDPILNEESIKEIQEYYVEMRNKTIIQDGKISAIPISSIQLDSIIILSEASARARLSNEICKEDAERAIKLMHYYLQQMGMNLETGCFDVDRILTGITATQKNQVRAINDILINLENICGKVIPLEDLFAEANLKDIEHAFVNMVIDRLKRNGDLFSPKEGFISRI